MSSENEANSTLHIKAVCDALRFSTIDTNALVYRLLTTEYGDRTIKKGLEDLLDCIGDQIPLNDDAQITKCFEVKPPPASEDEHISHGCK